MNKKLILGSTVATLICGGSHASDGLKEQDVQPDHRRACGMAISEPEIPHVKCYYNLKRTEEAVGWLRSKAWLYHNDIRFRPENRDIKLFIQKTLDSIEDLCASLDSHLDLVGGELIPTVLRTLYFSNEKDYRKWQNHVNIIFSDKEQANEEQLLERYAEFQHTREWTYYKNMPRGWPERLDFLLDEAIKMDKRDLNYYIVDIDYVRERPGLFLHRTVGDLQWIIRRLSKESSDRSQVDLEDCRRLVKHIKSLYNDNLNLIYKNRKKKTIKEANEVVTWIAKDILPRIKEITQRLDRHAHTE